MLGTYNGHHWKDENGKPGGGTSHGCGFCISWQNGPLGRGDERKEPNGAFVETIIDVARDRLDHYQESEFACAENAEAIEHLTAALAALNRRTMNRNERGVEGTHQP